MKSKVRHQYTSTLKKLEIIRLNLSSNARQRERGFTLLEVMIALAIIGVTLVVVLHTVNYHAEIMYQNSITTQMYQLAKEKMYTLEKSHTNVKGSLGTLYTFENRVSRRSDSEVIELKTTVTGKGKEVSLTELVIKK